ncbi:hypothetical protein [Spirosoma pomorum]
MVALIDVMVTVAHSDWIGYDGSITAYVGWMFVFSSEVLVESCYYVPFRHFSQHYTEERDGFRAGQTL